MVEKRGNGITEAKLACVAGLGVGAKNVRVVERGGGGKGGVVYVFESGHRECSEYSPTVSALLAVGEC
jgi:hypothetical protein